ncbi:Riboflavin_kinase [Hexamita inflata]|uniref:riboflavin kinase n=1 Tax=Hexamita inflata TaxID=28002 RepID=A0AA86QPT0_9EUKA|nr:Riboflavin kinase [Hexamita inflata]CAI9956959.1 Riboflavin kinase [Hexamita inflata]
MMIFSGPVVHGLQNGRKLNFPTANVLTNIVVDSGVYIGKAKLKDSIYNCIVFIGKSETFNIKNPTFEVHFLHNFNGQEFYNETIQVELYFKTRNNKKFETLDELKIALQQDKQQAFDYFNYANDIV